MPLTVAIVEDNAEICEGLEDLIRNSTEFRCVCSCRNAETALRKIPPERPDLIIMDIGLPDGSGVDCTAHLKRLIPTTEIMMFTVYEDNEQIFRALAAGASGYLLKRSSPDQLLESLRELVSGGAPMNGEVARKVIATFRQEPASPDKVAGLTPREHDVLARIAEGLSAKEIASRLSISVETVKVHTKRIYQKLHVRTRTEAVIAYLR